MTKVESDAKKLVAKVLKDLGQTVSKERLESAAREIAETVPPYRMPDEADEE